jgi:NAD(P)-dependent dehydrogenase (short-subunit alcohol dehydrogenase family)
MPIILDSDRTRRLTALGIGGLAGLKLLQRTLAADLSGQVALITGGSRGLGLALARELGAQGCKLAICARDESELTKAANELRAAGYAVLAEVCDVSHRVEIEAFVAEVEGHYGQIDLLITCAGEIQVGPVHDLTVEDFERIMAIDFWGTLYAVLAVLPNMRARQAGRIALITSIGGKISTPHLLTYSTAKFATVGLGEGLSAELAPAGIHVTTVVPGLMRTGSHIQAHFTGGADQRDADFAWFATGASMPIAPSAGSAARTIVDAIRHGKSEVIFPWYMSLASRANGAFPGLGNRALRLAELLLPDRPPEPGEPVATEPGEPIEDRSDSQVLETLTTLGRAAETDYNQR